MYGITGGINHPSITESLSFATTPDQTINYVSAHDNNTLYDKLRLTNVSVTDAQYMQIQANAIVLTAQGIPFIHAGAEMMRSKPLQAGGYDHNSYESPDIVNQLRWDRKLQYVNVFEYYKALIQIRKTYDHFRIISGQDIVNRIEFLPTSSGNQAIAFKIKGIDGSPDIIVIHAANPTGGMVVLNLEENKQYQLLTTLEGPTLENSALVTDVAFALTNSTAILVEYQGIGVNIKQKNMEITQGSTFNPSQNIEYFIQGLSYRTSSYMDSNVPGRYTITVSTNHSGTIKMDYFTVTVTGGKFNVTLDYLKGGQ
jgi:pullulanase